jgi:hypothetical protein
MTLTQVDLELLKQLRAAGDRGRNVRELKTRVPLDRLERAATSWLVRRMLCRSNIGSRSVAKTPS